MAEDLRRVQRYADVVGLIPMAGRAKRLAPLPCSKEIYPIGVDPLHGRPKVVAEYLIDKMRLAGIRNVLVVLRRGKWDIAEYFGDGALWDMHFAYLVMGLPFGPPYSMDQAHSFLSDKRVAFGFADILFRPDDAFAQLLDRQEDTKADVVLGLVHPQNPSEWDMISCDEEWCVRDIVLKPRVTDLSFGWICAVWTPTFTEFQHQFLSSSEARDRTGESNARIDAQGDLPVGAVLQAAIRKGLRIQSVPLENASFVDMGTPRGLSAAIEMFR